MAANKERGEVEVVLKAGPVVFRLDCNRMCELQAAMGCEDDHPKFAMRLLSGGLSSVRMAMRYMMLEFQPETTLEQAGDAITEMGLVRAKQLVNETLHWTFPPAEKSEGKVEAATETSAASPGLPH